MATRPPSIPAWLFLAAIIAGILVGCSQSPEKLLQKALTAEKAAQSALERNDVAAAERAADEAEKAVDRLQKLADADRPDRNDCRRLLQKAQVAARAARDHAGLAGEKRQRQDKLTGLKATAYRKAQTLVLSTVLPPMALAAEKAGQRGTNELSVIEKALAEQTWNVVSLVGNKALLPDGTPDWSGAALDLRTWSTNPPIEFKAFLGLTFVLLGQSDLALAEFESVDAGKLSGTNAFAIYHGGRALLYALQGWNRLAATEAEAFSRQAQLSTGPVDGRQLIALVHALTAYDAFTKREFARMDAAIAQSIRGWPDNPLAVFLTGEKLAANGEWKRAADSLEARTKGTQDEWIARRLAQRARDLRDGKGSTKALVLDARFLVEFAAHCVVTATRNSTVGRKLVEAIEKAASFGQDLQQRVPLW